MEITKIYRSGPRNKINVQSGNQIYVFWSDAEFKEFAVRNLIFKPTDIPLQDAVKAILAVAPKLDDKLLAIKATTTEDLKTLAVE